MDAAKTAGGMGSALPTGCVLGLALALASCSGGSPRQTALPATRTFDYVAPPGHPMRSATRGAHRRQILYVLVNPGTYTSYVALYDAYANNPKMLGKITQGLADPQAMWLDTEGNIYVGNDMASTSSVTVYSPKTLKLIRTYTDGIDLPFGGTVDEAGTLYVSVAGGANGDPQQGGIAIFPKGKTTPSGFLVDNICDYTCAPHGVAKDSNGNIIVAEVDLNQISSVLEFPPGSTKSKVLPLTHLKRSYLYGLLLDAHNDIVVADTFVSKVRFYPLPYKDQSKALSSSLLGPTGLAYGSDGSLFVGNEYVNQNNGNVVVFPPGSSKPTRTIVAGITGGVDDIAVSPP